MKILPCGGLYIIYPCLIPFRNNTEEHHLFPISHHYPQSFIEYISCYKLQAYIFGFSSCCHLNEVKGIHSRYTKRGKARFVSPLKLISKEKIWAMLKRILLNSLRISWVDPKILSFNTQSLGIKPAWIYRWLLSIYRSRGSSGSIVSDNGLDDRGSIPDKGRGFFFWPLRPDRLWGPPSLLPNGYRRVLSPGVKRGRGVMLATDHHLVPRLRMSRSYTSSPPRRLHGL
jgi:hypothetical protein